MLLTFPGRIMVYPVGGDPNEQLTFGIDGSGLTGLGDPCVQTDPDYNAALCADSQNIGPIMGPPTPAQAGALTVTNASGQVIANISPAQLAAGTASPVPQTNSMYYLGIAAVVAVAGLILLRR